MSEDYPTIAERFEKLKSETNTDDMTAALLVLADRIEDVAWAVKCLIDDSGHLNVEALVRGEIETHPEQALPPPKKRPTKRSRSG